MAPAKKEGRKGHPINRLTFVVIMIIVAIVGASVIIYVVFQASSEEAVRSSVFQQYSERQKTYASSVARNIESDMNLLMSKLETVARSKEIQDGDFADSQASALLNKIFAEANTINQIDVVYILDKEDVVVNSVNPSFQGVLLTGFDASELPPVIEYRSNLPNPTFSNAYVPNANSTLRITLLHPIYNSDTGEHLGSAGMAIVLDPFFSHYGNVNEIETQYLAALDSEGTVLTSAAREIVGMSVFSEYVYNLHEDKSAYDHYGRVMDGSSSVATFGFKAGGRLNVGEPIMLNGRPTYSLFVVTPTSAIYGEIDGVLATQRSQAILFLIVVAISISLLIFVLFRWDNTLNKAIRKRTMELEYANNRLKEHDKMQREFINIAAHELRTPIQPLIVVLELIQEGMDGKDRIDVSREDVEILARNAKRLERLASNILGVSRIDSQSLKLNKEPVELHEKIQNVIKDVGSFIEDNQRIEIVFDSASITEPVTVEADRVRLFEVLSNILRNSIIFTDKGTIRIKLSKDVEEKMAIVEISDSGSGIDPEILPQLFNKFVTRSEQGTGLGLYLSKGIVEAHGGKIWAENRESGGATFTFTLPLHGKN